MKTKQESQIRLAIIKTLAAGYVLAVRAYYFLFGKHYFDRYHIEAQFVDGRFSFQLYDHEEYTQLKTQELLELQKDVVPEDVLTQSFRICKNCNFIIFHCGDDDRFVQFWLGDGVITGDWPLIKKSKLKKYTLAMLGVLNGLDINQQPRKIGEWPHSYYQYYDRKVESDDVVTYKISFGKDSDKAAAFTKEVFAEVFKQNLEDLQFKVG